MALVLALVPGQTVAQQDETVLTVPSAPAMGMYETDAEGGLSGFSAELARLLADEAGLAVEFEAYDTLADLLAAQATGETDMLAGVARLPVLADTNVFSEPFAQMSTFLFVRADAPTDFGPDRLAGRPVGIIAGTGGSEFGSLDGRSEVVPFPDPASAFAALLSGRVDGVVTTHKIALDVLERMRLEQRVRVAGPPLGSEDHVVALHDGRAYLMPAIDAALGRLSDSGALHDLLVRWNMVPPAPVPDVLTVGIAPFPPYQVVEADGTMTGYGVEALQELARRAGLELAFEVITPEEWARGPAEGTYDMLPPLSVNEQRQERMDFTIPIQQSPYAIVTRAGEGEGIGGLEDLAGRRVGVAESNLARPIAEERGDLEVAVFGDQDSLFEGLLEGDVDAILYAAFTVRRLAERYGAGDRIEIPVADFFTSERAIALRPGLGAVRERLDTVIPGFLSSEEYTAIRERWLTEPQFWTAERIRAAQIVLAALGVLVVLLFLAQAVRGRRRAERFAAEMRAVNDRLAAILSATQSGIIGLTRDGRISAANPGAMRLLGINGGEPPYAWPDGIVFVDPEHMEPLEASRDPVRLALAGATLKNTLAIMHRPDDETGRYVAISSSPVAVSAASDVTAVLVLDDVTDRERTRQRAERAGRLDALGQLTGGVAHDFNNILATIEYAATLASPHTGEKGQRFITNALSSVRRGAELTRRLLAFAKRQPGIATSETVTRVLQEFEALAVPLIESQIEVRIEEEEEGLVVFCDIAQLENALINLVINARDAILESGTGDRILVKARRIDGLYGETAGGAVAPPGEPGQFIELSVSDNGPGMSDEVKSRATDPFFTTRERRSGTGLGLAMVYGFAEQSGGELKIYSHEGLGTTVRLVLPAASEATGRPEVVAEQDPPRGAGQTILLVEDEDDLLSLTAAALRNLDYKVVEATSGTEALDIVEAGKRFDLLLTDIVMPGMGGFDLARRVRSRYETVPVVYMSGYVGISKQDMGDVLGPLLQKPCAPAELAAVVSKALQSA